MRRRVVAMSLIPGLIPRGTSRRVDLSYAACGRRTWEWWCRRHNATFFPIESNLGGPDLEGAPPTFLRWLAPDFIFKRFGQETELLIVDADTMVRWDMPDIFGPAAGEFSAVRGGHPGWIARSLEAFRPFFPDTALPVSDYFNAGLVLLRPKHLCIFEALTKFYLANRTALEELFRSSNCGTDQTPLNFIANASGFRVNLLPSEFNLLHCVGGRVDYLRPVEAGFTGILPSELLSASETFAFIERGYVWHFSNAFSTRAEIMKQTWNRVAHHYC